jgi:UDPglucose 6-dehydrogenase
MKIGIIGLGFVGLTFASILADKKYDVIGIDKDKVKMQKIKTGKSPFYEPRLNDVLKRALIKKFILSEKIEDVVENCDLIFVTVGTPMTKSGDIDLKIILNVCKKIGKALLKTKNIPTIIIKSTVIPGTAINEIKKILEKTSKKKSGVGFELISNPEFLREGKAVEDTLHPHIIVIGKEGGKVNRLTKFYKKFYSSKIPIILTNTTTAEMIKYANNSFLATKISFINNIANLCQILPGTNVDDIAKAIGIDPRIGKQFLNAGPGFGGSCLPKDLQAMIKFSKEIGEETRFFKAVYETNILQVEKIIKLINKHVGEIKNKKISILGLSFKEDSDDIRESVSIKLIKNLVSKHAIVMVHDPKALKNTKKIFEDKIFYFDKIDDVLNKSQCAIVMTPWKQYSKIKKSSIQKMKNKVIIDTRRMLNLKTKDFTYVGLGIGK